MVRHLEPVLEPDTFEEEFNNWLEDVEDVDGDLVDKLEWFVKECEKYSEDWEKDHE